MVEKEHKHKAVDLNGIFLVQPNDQIILFIFFCCFLLRLYHYNKDSDLQAGLVWYSFFYRFLFLPLNFPCTYVDFKLSEYLASSAGAISNFYPPPLENSSPITFPRDVIKMKVMVVKEPCPFKPRTVCQRVSNSRLIHSVHSKMYFSIILLLLFFFNNASYFTIKGQLYCNLQ